MCPIKPPKKVERGQGGWLCVVRAAQAPHTPRFTPFHPRPLLPGLDTQYHTYDPAKNGSCVLREVGSAEYVLEMMRVRT